MMASPCGEIEAAKQRLVVSKKWETSAEKRVKDLEDQLRDAKADLASARNEVETSEEYLKDKEKKWEVIDVDGDSPARPKRKAPALIGRNEKSPKSRANALSPPSSVRRISSRQISICVHVRPGRLGLIVKNKEHGGNLEVGRVLDDSQIRDEVQKGDWIVEYDGVDTGEW